MTDETPAPLTTIDDHLVPWFKVRGDDRLDQGIMRRCLLCGRTSRIVSSTVSPSEVSHEPTCEVVALRAALAADATPSTGLDEDCTCEPEHVWPCAVIQRCDEPGCEREATCGWPTRPGGTGPNGGYRRTCGQHMPALSASPTETP